MRIPLYFIRIYRMFKFLFKLLQSENCINWIYFKWHNSIHITHVIENATSKINTQRQHCFSAGIFLYILESRWPSICPPYMGNELYSRTFFTISGSAVNDLAAFLELSTTTTKTYIWSAKSLIWLLFKLISLISLFNIWKRKGPSSEPWGTPTWVFSLYSWDQSL